MNSFSPLVAVVCLGLSVSFGVARPAHGAEVQPLRWGVDDAGVSASFEDSCPWAGDALTELGVNLLVAHARDHADFGEMAAGIRRLDAFCDGLGIDWICNLESANWVRSFEDNKGRDWFNREDGRHFELYPDDILAVYGACKRLKGIMYDEAAHMQNCLNMVANDNKPFKPWVYAPGLGDRLEDAAEGFTRAVSELGALHQRFGMPLYEEHVFPVLYHAFARAGWTPSTKVLKENWSPVYMAAAMGAAIEYGKELWVTPDLWYMDDYPGHSVDEYRSSLLLAYHLGADAIYTENLAFDYHHDGTGGLIADEGDHYRLTPHGETAKSFIHDYVPAHPRHYSLRDLKPRVVIVRQPDACWGQRVGWMGDRLFGNDAWPSTDATESWIKAWNLLTLDTVKAEGLSWHAGPAYFGFPYQVLCPVDGVVVYDHLVGKERLQGAEVIFLAGIGVSDRTLNAIEACVRAGTTCIALPSLLPVRLRETLKDGSVLEEGAGRWVSASDFLSTLVREHVAGVLPQPGTLRYRFGNTDVILRAVEGDPNRLEAEVRDAR